MSRFPTRAKPEERSQSRAYFELWGQVDFLAPRVLAALPATHPAAAAFTAFKSTQDNLPDEIEMPAQLLNAAMQAYRDLSDEERHTVMNGWTVDADFTSHAALKFGVEAVQIALNCCTLEIDGNRSRCTAFDDAIGGDSHQAPLTLHILAGTSYADTMRALDQAREMIDSCWRYIISGHFITGADGKFVTDTAIEKKSGRTAADARLPGQLPSTNAAELTAPMNPDDTGNDLAKSITELRDWAAALVA